VKLYLRASRTYILYSHVCINNHYKKTIYYWRINFDGYKFVGNFFFPTDLSTNILCEHYRRIDLSVICFWNFFIYLPTDWSVGKFPRYCAPIYQRNLLLYRRIISFGNFLAVIKIEFRSSPNSVSLKTRKGGCRGKKVQSSVVARAVPSNPFLIQGFFPCRRDVATMSVPWPCRDVRGYDAINSRELRLRSSSRSPA